MTEEELLNSPYALEQAEISKKRARETAEELKPSDKVYAVIGDIEFLTTASIELLKQRGQKFHDDNRLGEKRPCRNDDGYQFLIFPNQIKELIGCSDSTVYRIQTDIRLTLGKEKGDYITVHEFCKLTNLPEEETRKALKFISPDFTKD
jgi:hydrogenase maturation factor